MSRNLVLGITGASGAPYAVRLLKVLLAAGRDVHLVVSPAGKAVLKQELGIEVDLENFDAGRMLHCDHPLLGPGSPERLPVRGEAEGRILYHHYRDLMAPVASGSCLTAGMVVCPCSGGTLSAIAHGSSENLIHRAADVHIKERRKLIVVPRETPLSLIQLDNMRRVAEAGAVVLPAMPGFYHGAKTVRDLIDFVVARICDQLGLPNELMQRWGAHGPC
jgi:4-hydroxy-3-polyprenylbenzoate decarboxylase